MPPILGISNLYGREVDLLVEMPDGYFAFEIKMTENVSETDAKHLRKLADLFDKPVKGAFVISNAVAAKSLGDGVTAVNAAMLLG